MDRRATEAFFRDVKPNQVFHAAGRVYGILGNMRNHGLSFFDNLTINSNVVEAARKVNVDKITVMGTGAVYPYPSPGIPLKEEMIFEGRPHTSERGYADAKRAMLAMLEAYAGSYGLRWAYIVSCNLFGPRDRFDEINGHVVPALVSKFYRAKQSGTMVNVWGNGSAQRDFMYVKDAARVAHCVMANLEGAVNIGSGTVLRIKDVVEMLADVSEMQDRVVWDASKPNGQDYREYDLSRVNAAGFRCKYSIRDGLKETWEWYCNEGGVGAITVGAQADQVVA
jgi:GDP-L-fucose synthase